MLWPILRQVFHHPLRIAVTDDQRDWRYIDLLVGAMHLAERIEQASSAKHVGIILPTGGVFPMALLAIWLLKRTAVPINYLLSAEERQFIADDSEIDTLVTAGLMINFLGGPPKGVKLIEVDKMNFTAPPPLRWPPVADADDTAVILYTSGTSGKPKGVMLTHANLRSDVELSIRHVRLTSADTFLGVLPQFHSFGLTGLTILPLSIGSRIVNTARFSPRRVVQLIRKHKPDLVMFIPSMYAALLTVKEGGPEDFASIRLAVSGGEPLSRDVYDRFEKRFGLKLREGYGLTETSPIVAINTVDEFKPGSVGRLLPSVDCRIVDDEGRDQPRNAEGEVLLRGPMIMKGYFKQPALTAQVMSPDDFFRTGDWGKIDDDGYLSITGRKKEMLIIGGENVFPREIEEVLRSHAAVEDAAVIGQTDPLRGELPIAFIELAEGTAFSEEDLRAHCRSRLAGFKVPREIRVMEKLPRNPTGKILRRALAEKLKAEPSVV
jgi:long-chain acyl-CoA synthetase